MIQAHSVDELTHLCTCPQVLPKGERFVFEFCHPSWFCQRTYDVLAANDWCLAAIDLCRGSPEEPPGPPGRSWKSQGARTPTLTEEDILLGGETLLSVPQAEDGTPPVIEALKPLKPRGHVGGLLLRVLQGLRKQGLCGVRRGVDKRPKPSLSEGPKALLTRRPKPSQSGRNPVGSLEEGQ